MLLIAQLLASATSTLPSVVWLKFSINAIDTLALTAIVSLLLVAGIVLGLQAHGNRLLSVQTASMMPTIRPGDAVLVKRVKAPQLWLGQVISYTSPRSRRLVITHRLVAVNHQTGWLTTQGDAFRVPDPSFPPDLVVGQVTALAPGLGHVLNVLHHSLGLVLAVYLPAAAIIVAEAARLGRTYARPFYSARLGA